MSWYEVNYTCGHNDRMQVYGPTRDRQTIADRESRKDCPECWRKKQDARNAESALAASCDAAAAGLPSLVGSDKQVAWAETIRAKMLAELKPIVVSAKAKQSLAEQGRIALDDPRYVQLQAAIDAQADSYRMQASAKWWIDHRTDSLYNLCTAKVGELARAMFAAEVQIQKDKLASEATDRQATRDHELALTRAENDAAKVAGETAAAQFVPIRVERLNGQDFHVIGEDYHLAKGYQMDGETVVYQIDDVTLDTLLPKATALSARIRPMVPKR
jgi:hypothetical protein